MPHEAVGTFRIADPSDVAAIVELVESAYRGDSSRAGWTTEADLLGGQRTDLEAVDDLIRAADSQIVLLEVGGELVACCHLALEARRHRLPRPVRSAARRHREAGSARR